MRLDIRKTGVIKNGETVVGNKARVKIVKNKVAPPFREADFEITYGAGVNWPAEAVDLGTEANLLEKSGAFYSWKGERFAQGREKACAYLAEHPEIAEEIRLNLIEARKAENRALGAPGTSNGTPASAAAA